MAVKKTTTRKTDFEKKIDDVKKTTTQTAKKVEEESKKIMTGVGSWRHNSTDEERIYMVLGIILLLLGLWILRDFVKGLLFIIIGLLFVTGFFVNNRKK